MVPLSNDQKFFSKAGENILPAEAQGKQTWLSPPGEDRTVLAHSADAGFGQGTLASPPVKAYNKSKC